MPLAPCVIRCAAQRGGRRRRRGKKEEHLHPTTLRPQDGRSDFAARKQRRGVTGVSMAEGFFPERTVSLGLSTSEGIASSQPVGVPHQGRSDVRALALPEPRQPVACPRPAPPLSPP